LSTGTFPIHLSPELKKELALKAFPFTLHVGVFYRQGQDWVLKCCPHLEEISMIIKEMHNDVGGGHLSTHIINQKILDAKYWWPTLHKDV
jgi:hypothetical protein